MFLKDKVKYLLVLFSFLCFSAFAQLAPRDASYYESAGAFKNPEFVERDAGWEISGCALGASYSTVVPFAARTLTVTCVLETLTIRQCSDKFLDLKDAYLDAYSNVKANATSTDLYWRITDGTNIIQSYTLKQDDEWHPISSAPFFASDTGNCIEIVSEPNFTGAVSVTQANIKQNFQFAQLAFLNPQTGWENKGPITVTSTGTQPSKGTPLIDSLSCRREGPDMKLRYKYKAGVAGTKGDGIYLLALPSSCAGTDNPEIDSEQVNFYTGVDRDKNLEALESNMVLVDSTVVLTGEAYAYDSTHLRMVGKTSLIASGSSVLWDNIGPTYTFVDNAASSLYLNVTVPIKQWRLGTTAVTEQVNFDNLDNHAYYVALVDGNVSPSTVSDENANFINGNCERTATGSYNCPLVAGAVTNPNFCFPVRLANTESADSSCLLQNTSTVSNLRITCRAAGNTAYNTVFRVMCFKTGEDYQKAFRSTMLGLFNQSNIVQDVEQFPTTEQKLCDACYEGNPLYKRCWNSLPDANSVLQSTVSRIYKVYGQIEFAGAINGPMSFPFSLGGAIYATVAINSGNLVVKKEGMGTDARFCVEYSKD